MRMQFDAVGVQLPETRADRAALHRLDEYPMSVRLIGSYNALELTCEDARKPAGKQFVCTLSMFRAEDVRKLGAAMLEIAEAMDLQAKYS